MENFSTTNLLTLVIALLAAAATLGGVMWRVGRVEKDVEVVSKRVDEKISEFQHAREGQGVRIGDVEKDVVRLIARAGMVASESESRRPPRRLTKPTGEKV